VRSGRTERAENGSSCRTEPGEACARALTTGWAERVAAELRASGESVGQRDPDREASLTAQELQVAHLVADGLTSKGDRRAEARCAFHARSSAGSSALPN